MHPTPATCVSVSASGLKLGPRRRRPPPLRRRPPPAPRRWSSQPPFRSLSPTARHRPFRSAAATSPERRRPFPPRAVGSFRAARRRPPPPSAAGLPRAAAPSAARRRPFRAACRRPLPPRAAGPPTVVPALSPSTSPIHGVPWYANGRRTSPISRIVYLPQPPSTNIEQAPAPPSVHRRRLPVGKASTVDQAT
nr:formin-like protein 5 [Lolium perenne]